MLQSSDRKVIKLNPKTHCTDDQYHSFIFNILHTPYIKQKHTKTHTQHPYILLLALTTPTHTYPPTKHNPYTSKTLFPNPIHITRTTNTTHSNSTYYTPYINHCTKNTHA